MFQCFDSFGFQNASGSVDLGQLQSAGNVYFSIAKRQMILCRILRAIVDMKMQKTILMLQNNLRGT